MTMEFSVLASGSSGNVSLLRAGGYGVLIDLGLGPRQLARRLQQVGSSWKMIQAVLLSHTHGDHWNENSLRHLLEHQIPLYCHVEHQDELNRQSTVMAQLRSQHLLRLYHCDVGVPLVGGWHFRALALSHDSGVTCGFRLEGPPDFFGFSSALGYVSDLGTWELSLAQALANVDILAVEFNHDVALECNSGRDPHLIARVLGDAGHLSNEQAAGLVHEILRRSKPGRVQHLVQLHLSRQCNRPGLARTAALEMLEEFKTDLTVHTASQDRPGPILRLNPGSFTFSSRLDSPKKSQPALHHQPLLPGWES